MSDPTLTIDDLTALPEKMRAHAAAQREALSDLVLGLSHDRPGATLEEVGQLMQRLTDRHQLRMGRLGLSA
mgnify:CR=1 FL=1